MKFFGVSLVAIIVLLFVGFLLGRNFPGVIPKLPLVG